MLLLSCVLFFSLENSFNWIALMELIKLIYVFKSLNSIFNIIPFKIVRYFCKRKKMFFVVFFHVNRQSVNSRFFSSIVSLQTCRGSTAVQTAADCAGLEMFFFFFLKESDSRLKPTTAKLRRYFKDSSRSMTTLSAQSESGRGRENRWETKQRDREKKAPGKKLFFFLEADHEIFSANPVQSFYVCHLRQRGSALVLAHRHITVLEFVFQSRAAVLPVIPLKSESVFFFFGQFLVNLLRSDPIIVAFMQFFFFSFACFLTVFLHISRFIFPLPFFFSLDLLYHHESGFLATGSKCGVAYGKFRFQLQELSAPALCNHIEYFKLLEILHLANAGIFAENNFWYEWCILLGKCKNTQKAHCNSRRS